MMCEYQWDAYQELFLFFHRRLVVEATSLNDFVVDIKLISCTSVHCLFHTLFGNETQNANSLCLTNTVGTILSLQVGVRIPKINGSLVHTLNQNMPQRLTNQSRSYNPKESTVSMGYRK